MMPKFTTPLIYLRVRHAEKTHYDWTGPILLTALVLLGLAAADFNVSGETGILVRILDFIRLMTGFFVASLGVVVSLKNDSMDQPMENSPLLRGRELTRRRYLAMTFGYLAAISLAIYILGTAIDIATASTPKSKLAYIFATPVIFGFFQIICITGVGLHYLSERILRPPLQEPTLAISPETPEPASLRPKQRRPQ